MLGEEMQEPYQQVDQLTKDKAHVEVEPNSLAKDTIWLRGNYRRRCLREKKQRTPYSPWDRMLTVLFLACLDL